MEIWKDIPDYEGLYQISNLGNVKSIKSKTKILKPGLNSCGYLSVVLYKSKIAKTIKVHQLVAMAFLGHKRCGFKKVINHINFNRQDNRLCNIEVVTSRENGNKKHISSSSKYTGVSWDKKNKKWEAYINIKNTRKRLGRFVYEFEAFMAYEKAKRNLINT